MKKQEITSIEANVFQKSGCSKKVALQKKRYNAKYHFSEKLAFFQNATLLKKLMLYRSTCFEKVALL